MRLWLLSSRDFIYGLLGGVIATVSLYFGTGFFGLPFPPEALFQLIISPASGSVESFAVENFREYAKYSAFTFASAIYSVLYGLIAVAVARFSKSETKGRQQYGLFIAILLPTVIGLGLEASLASTVSTLSSALGWIAATVLLVVVNSCYALIAVKGPQAQLIGAMQPAGVKGVKPLAAPSRRGFLKKVVMAAVALAVAGVAAKLGLSALSGQPLVGSNTPFPVNSQTTGTSVSGLPDIFGDPRIAGLVGSEVTDNRIFYRVDINAVPPKLNFDQWQLNVHGKVNNPFTLNKSSLLNMPTVDEYATLECVSNTINPPGALISNAKWTGVPLSMVLDQAGLTSDARYLVFHCADGYTVGIPVDRAMEKGALLAYKMNDELLPNEHGFPLRAIVPGIYGMMNGKWITEIEAVDQVYLGYWQERGWSNDARIKTTSIIYYPPANAQVGGSLPIAGVAFAGDRGISKVEVSTDGGQTWNEATLKTPKSPYSWVLWAFQWTPTTKGTSRIVVRATDGTGQLQDPSFRDPFPEGASGYTSLSVTVT